MDNGRGGCCIARYGADTAGYNMSSKIDRIMLRFRPIAPKPATSAAEPPASESKSHVGRGGGGGGRGRRKSAANDNRNSSSNNGRKRKSSSRNQTAGTDLDLNHQKGVTLSLLPETPDLCPPRNYPQSHKMPFWLSFNDESPGFEDNILRCHSGVGPDRMAAVSPPVVGSYVIVEGITDTWTDVVMTGHDLGWSTEEERMRKLLEEDTCPGFLSDAWNRVCWANEAYRRMAIGDALQDQERDRDTCRVVVWLVMREKIPDTLQAFTCRVRVQRSAYDGKETRGSSPPLITLPCDAWRMDGGGFAWRLDVKAALCLGR